MATSDSDDFESADEELVSRDTNTRKISNQWKNSNSAIDSESDDDNECMQQPVGKTIDWNSGNRSVQTSGQERRVRNSVDSSKKSDVTDESTIMSTVGDCKDSTAAAAEVSTKIGDATKITAAVKQISSSESKNIISAGKKKIKEEANEKLNINTCSIRKERQQHQRKPKESKSLGAVKLGAKVVEARNILDKKTENIRDRGEKLEKSVDTEQMLSTDDENIVSAVESKIEGKINEEDNEKLNSDTTLGRKDREQRQNKPKESKRLSAMKLGSKVAGNTAKPTSVDAKTPDEIREKAIAEGKEPPLIQECWEFNEEETAEILQGMKDFGIGDGDNVKMPEELISDKKFKEIFKPDGWEDLDNEKILAELDENRVLPILDKIALSGEISNTGWGSWGGWGVSSLINSATAGVSTLTSHVTHGLELLDQAVGAPHPEELVTADTTDDNKSIEEKSSSSQEIQSQLSFGFNDFMSGVSSITKLVESTGTKVITGGLGTLETIGKKTMEVLQEGDPGLKKKRAFFLNETNKPILSQMLREAKEKADVEEKTFEDKQMTRKVHFESLFDDYQGLVHLEALEMLSKQCNMKIQQRLVTLDSDELNSIQETLEEVTELCDLGDDDDEEENTENLQERLKSACADLGVAINCEKLQEIWKDTRDYLTVISTPESTITEREVFQRAISTLARFTAFSVERFHKTAELLLIKERRSTVNEADALVQLTRIFSGQIGIAANTFSNLLNERINNTDKPNSSVDITTIFLEAANASSYIQDAFRLLIPILQVGAI